MKIGGKPTDVSFIGLRGWIRDLYASVQCCCFGAIVEEIFKGSDPVDPSQIPSSLRKQRNGGIERQAEVRMGKTERQRKSGRETAAAIYESPRALHRRIPAPGGLA